MPNSPRMNWPYPSEDKDPWYDSFESFVNAQDASVFASRDDRQLIMAKGGSWSWTASTNTVVWDAALEILTTLKGVWQSMAAGTETISDGQSLYVVVTRSPTNNVTLTAAVSNQVPNTDNAYVICTRRGDALYFRHGMVLEDGMSVALFTPATQGTTLIWSGGRETHDSSVTPLIAGAFALSPLSYVPVGSIVFRAVAANGDTGLTNYVRLYNVTDGEQVAELEFTSTDIAKDEAVLTRGSGSGEIDDPEHIYEVRIILGAPAGGPDDTIELYSAELRFI